MGIENLYRRGTGQTSGEKALTKAQVETLLTNIDRVPDLALFSMAISTGIRREDIVAIKRKDVNLEEHSVTFYETKKRITRTVFLPSRTMQVLQLYLNMGNKSEWLFPSPHTNKHHISGRQMYRRFNQYLEKAGLPKRPFHALRATCYKLAKENGWTPEEAARHIGDTVKVAMEHYGTPSREALKAQAMEKPII